MNLSTPLIVKTKTGEVLAGPGDIVGRFQKHDVMMSKDLYISLFSEGEYDELVKKEMMARRVAGRVDDGLPPYTEEEMAEQEKAVDETLAAKKEAEAKAKEEKETPLDPASAIQFVSSSEGPPTASPSEYATMVPGPVPLPEEPDVEEEEEVKTAETERATTQNLPPSNNPFQQ